MVDATGLPKSGEKRAFRFAMYDYRSPSLIQRTSNNEEVYDDDDDVTVSDEFTCFNNKTCRRFSHTLHLGDLSGARVNDLEHGDVVRLFLTLFKSGRILLSDAGSMTVGLPRPSTPTLQTLHDGRTIELFEGGYPSGTFWHWVRLHGHGNDRSYSIDLSVEGQQYNCTKGERSGVPCLSTRLALQGSAPFHSGHPLASGTHGRNGVPDRVEWALDDVFYGGSDAGASGWGYVLLDPHEDADTEDETYTLVHRARKSDGTTHTHEIEVRVLDDDKPFTVESYEPTTHDGSDFTLKLTFSHPVYAFRTYGSSGYVSARGEEGQIGNDIGRGLDYRYNGDILYGSGTDLYSYRGDEESRLAVDKYAVDWGVSYVAFDLVSVTGGGQGDGEFPDPQQDDVRNAWSREFEIFISPSSDTSTITVTVPNRREGCRFGHVFCSALTTRPLDRSQTLTIGPVSRQVSEDPPKEPKDTQDERTPPLTASFDDAPGSHTGSEFTLDLNFSADVVMGFARLQADVLNVTGGTVRGVQRNTQGSNASWQITVRPNDADTAVAILIPATTDCSASSAVCSKADNTPLANGAGLLIPASVPATTPSLTASFDNAPASHTGSEFSLDLTFSADVSMGFARLRDDVLSVTGGTVTSVQRKTAGSNASWSVTVEPTNSSTDVTLAIAATTDCSASSAVCSKADDTPLADGITLTVPAG